MIVCRDQPRALVGAFAPAIGAWQQMKSRRWARTSLRRVSPTRTMASMWAPAPSFTMPPSHLTGAGRWCKGPDQCACLILSLIHI